MSYFYLLEVCRNKEVVYKLLSFVAGWYICDGNSSKQSKIQLYIISTADCKFGLYIYMYVYIYSWHLTFIQPVLYAVHFFACGYSPPEFAYEYIFLMSWRAILYVCLKVLEEDMFVLPSLSNQWKIIWLYSFMQY